MKKPLVRLNNGKTVPLEEFVKWSAQKQGAQLMSVETRNRLRNIARSSHRPVITPKGEFPSIRAAAIGNQTTTTKLLRLIFNLDIAEYKFVAELEKDRAKYFSKDDNKNIRKVITPLGVFPTVKDAAKALGTDGGTLRRLIYDTTNVGFSFATTKERDVSKYYDGNVRRKIISNKSARPVITPKGEFPSLREAAKAFNIGDDVLRRYVFNTAYPEFRYVTPQPQDKAKEFHKIILKAFKYQTVFVRTPKGDFESITAAAKAYGIEWHKMSRRIGSEKYPEFFKIDTDNASKPIIQSKVMKKTVTPLGSFNSKVEAMRAHKIPRNEFQKLLMNRPLEYYHLED